MYKCLVRPDLDYCTQAWRLHLQEDIALLEKVQRRATRMIDGFSNMTYEQRLKELNLRMLETRRIEGDFFEVFKILMGYEHVEYSEYFTLSTRKLRGHNFKFFSLEY